MDLWIQLRRLGEHYCSRTRLLQQRRPVVLTLKWIKLKVDPAKATTCKSDNHRTNVQVRERTPDPSRRVSIQGLRPLPSVRLLRSDPAGEQHARASGRVRVQAARARVVPFRMQRAVALHRRPDEVPHQGQAPQQTPCLMQRTLPASVNNQSIEIFPKQFSPKLQKLLETQYTFRVAFLSDRKSRFWLRVGCCRLQQAGFSPHRRATEPVCVFSCLL